MFYLNLKYQFVFSFANPFIESQGSIWEYGPANWSSAPSSTQSHTNKASLITSKLAPSKWSQNFKILVKQFECKNLADFLWFSPNLVLSSANLKQFLFATCFH